MTNLPSHKNVSFPNVSSARSEFGWSAALRFIENGLGLRTKNKTSLDKKHIKHHAGVSALEVEASSKEIALHLLRIYHVRQAVEETLAGLVYLIDDLKGSADSAARQALSGLRAGSTTDAIFYYRQCAEIQATGGGPCRVASDYFTNEAVLTFVGSLPAALKAGLLATQSDPSHKRAWEVYGTLQMCCGQFTAAEQSFARVQALTA